MKLLEYESKQLLKTSGLAVPKSKLVPDLTTDVFLPSVIKSQVPVGGRGKAGGIAIVSTSTEAMVAINRIKKLAIGGYTPRVLLAEEAIDIDHEYYLSLVINREKSYIELVASTHGGIDVESHSDDEFFRREINPENIEGLGDSLSDLLNISDKSFVVQDILTGLYKCFVDNDATLLEINPLILSKTGALIAGDCKMILDDAAAFRHPEWDFEDKPASSNFVSLNQNGAVATIANGAGLAMATVDAVGAAGLTPANFLDIGGDATVEKIVTSFVTISKFSNVTAIIINIFGGIVRCDTVALAIVEACRQLSDLPELYIRLAGNAAEEAADILSSSGIYNYSSLAEIISILKGEKND